MTVPRKASKKILAALDQVLVGWCATGQHTRMFSLQGEPLVVSLRMARLTIGTRLPWNCLCTVLCRSQLKEQYMKSEAIRTVNPRTQPELAPLLNEQHQRLLREANPQHLMTAGWVASPTGREIPLDIAAKILEHLQGWQCLAPWELPHA